MWIVNIKDVDGYDKAKSDLKHMWVKYKVGTGPHGPDADGDRAASSTGLQEYVLLYI